MDTEESIRLAVIAGASHALDLKRELSPPFPDDLLQKIASDVPKILVKLGETRSSDKGKLFSLAAITGASQALRFAERNPKKSDRDALQHVTREMEAIISNIDLKE